MFATVKRKTIISITMLAGFVFVICQFTMAQDISFFHLSKKEGLSDNQVSAIVMDQNGLLWVGTAEGLNCFDGYTVKRFYKEEYPAIQNNNILRMTCDEKNRLWIHFSDKSISMLDENRQFHDIAIMDKGEKIAADFLLPYTSRGVLFLAGSRLYMPDKNNPLKITRLPWAEDSSLNNNFVRINIWDKDKLICSGNNRVALFDVTNLKVLYTFTVQGILAAAKLNDEEAIITTYNDDKLCKLNFAEKKITKNYSQLKDQYGEEMMIFPRSIYHFRNEQFIFTSAYAGLYLFDAKNETLTRYKHDPVDPRTISANNTNFLFSDTSGYFFVTSHSGGLSYFNKNHYLGKWQPSFRDQKTGRIFDGYINCINQSTDGNIWLGTQTSLIEWNRKNNTMRFHPYGKINGQPLEGTEEIRSICFDKKGRMWIGLNRFGILVMDNNKQVIKYLNTGTKENKLAGNFIYDIKEAPDGKIWIATSTGLNIVNPENFQVTKPAANSFLETLSNKTCRYIFFRNKNEVWIGTAGGAYRINLNDGKFKVFNSENGIRGYDALCIAEDGDAGIYIGTGAGMNIIKGDSIIAFFDRTNGLSSNKCEGLRRDNQGKMWIGNNNALLCYEPFSKRFIRYDESAGLSGAGFREIAFFKTVDGEIFWGSDKGVSYFYPHMLRQLKLPVEAVVNNITTADTSYWLATSKHLDLPFNKNTISFSFSAIDLYSSRNILYKYKLEGSNDDWTIVPTPQDVQYSSLPSGDYTFRVMASKDGRQWMEAKNTISFTVLTPWWRSVWFIATSSAALIFLIGFISYRRTKKIKQQQEDLETEKAVNYLSSSIYDQHTEEEILWDVAKNCISHLHFEDSVIYLKDEQRNVLVQKAAWGPKTKKENRILNPLEIPVGKGITGHVAASGKAEIVNDTSKDKRYIVDDATRLSEIAVPIIYDGKVFGIIDSEHPKKNFFTKKHLSILSTIASLCANKIVRVRAEEEKQKAQLALLEHERKTAEAQLKSLRLQMNPHFLFNSLNSIQQMILAGEEAAATLYLSKFSKMLRLVLSHSDKEKVSLKEELETLKLYVELESLRFNETFTYEIICDEEVDTDETKIPTLLIQPFVENAIWHGLLHKEGKRFLSIKFTEDTAENLVCMVEDNGIGRAASARINGKTDHNSKGISVAEERLKTYNEQYLQKSNVLIEDMEDYRGIATGTRVTVTLPLLN